MTLASYDGSHVRPWMENTLLGRVSVHIQIQLVAATRNDTSKLPHSRRLNITLILSSTLSFIATVARNLTSMLRTFRDVEGFI